MPGGDRTGPLGEGPKTGRAAGYCAGNKVPGFMNPVPGGAPAADYNFNLRGAGRGGLPWGGGRGRVFGGGRGCGWMRAAFHNRLPEQPQDTAVQLESQQNAIDKLAEQTASVKDVLDRLEERLKDMK